MSKQTLISELTKEVQQAKSMYQELVGDDDNDLTRCLFETKIRAYSHALDLVEYHIHDEKDVLDINQIEKQIIDTVNDFLSCVKPSREANAFVYDVLKQKITLALKDYNRNSGWISVNDELPYCHIVFSTDWYEDWHTNKYCPLQIVTKDNMLRTAVFLEMKIQDFHGEKLFWLCDVENLYGMFIIHEISEDFLEINEVKYWQPLQQPPKE